MSRAIGLILTITGAVLLVWFYQVVALPGAIPLESFVVAAMGVAMVSVGIRYILKSSKTKSDKKSFFGSLLSKLLPTKKQNKD